MYSIGMKRICVSAVALAMLIMRSSGSAVDREPASATEIEHVQRVVSHYLVSESGAPKLMPETLSDLSSLMEKTKAAEHSHKQGPDDLAAAIVALGAGMENSSLGLLSSEPPAKPAYAAVVDSLNVTESQPYAGLEPEPVDVAKDILGSLISETNSSLSSLISRLAMPSWNLPSPSVLEKENAANATQQAEIVSNVLEQIASSSAMAEPEYKNPVLVVDDVHNVPTIKPPSFKGLGLRAAASEPPSVAASNVSVISQALGYLKGAAGYLFDQTKAVMAQGSQDLKRRFALRSMVQTAQDMASYCTGQEFAVASGSIRTQLMLWTDVSVLWSMIACHRIKVTLALIVFFAAYKIMLQMFRVSYETALANLNENFWDTLAYSLKFMRLEEDGDAPSGLHYFRPT